MTDKPVTGMEEHLLKLANELILYFHVSRNLMICSSGTCLFAHVPSEGRSQCDAVGAFGKVGNPLADLNACHGCETLRIQAHAGAIRQLTALELILVSRL